MADDIKGVPAGLIEEPNPSASGVQGVPAGLLEEPMATASAASGSDAPPAAPVSGWDWNGPRGTLTKGIVKGAGDTVSAVAHAIHKIPVVGETLAPQQGIDALDKMTEAQNTGEMIGKGIETAGEVALTAGATSEVEMVKLLQEAEKLTGAARAAKFVDLARKYPILADTFNLATNHPWLSKMILEGGKGAVSGGVEGGVKQKSAKGAAQGAAIGLGTGVATAAAPLLFNPFRKMANAASDYISDIWQGASKSREPAEAAMREGVQTGAGVPTVQPTKVREALDAPIDALGSAASKNYQIMDKATGGEWQPNVDKLRNINQELRATAGTNDAREAELQASKTRLEWQQEALLDKAKANGVTKDVVDLARSQFRKSQALQDLDAKVFKNFSVVDLDGNIKVDNALKALYKLRDNTTWGGSRLEQALDKNTSVALIKSLEDARAAGVTAMKRQELAKHLGKYIGMPTAGAAAVASGEYLYHVLLGDSNS